MARRTSRPKRPEPPATGVLDWEHGHWKPQPLPCRYGCDGWPTHLRDSKGRPAHKVCAEAALAQQVRDYAEAYENERLRLT
ncbi:hypothetical protein ABTX34_16870 [Streptomyces sp. NPDC096538]|uniref:hypothetical protein n=1 Tax=Streptomyces sp. NPDC096538 TaxID=3155427 RepID=UPI00332CA035